MATVSQQDVIDYIKGISVMELSQLVKALESELGVSATAPVSVQNMMLPVEPSQVLEQTEFEVRLDAIGDNKINVIKVIREITSLGLKEAKDFVESAPKVVKESVSKQEAEVLKKKLEAVGATISIN